MSENPLRNRKGINWCSQKTVPCEESAHVIHVYWLIWLCRNSWLLKKAIMGISLMDPYEILQVNLIANEWDYRQLYNYRSICYYIYMDLYCTRWYYFLELTYGTWFWMFPMFSKGYNSSRRFWKSTPRPCPCGRRDHRLECEVLQRRLAATGWWPESPND